jgi:hypothetical protein
MSLITHMVVKALALSTRDQTCSPPSIGNSSRCTGVLSQKELVDFNICE